MPYLIVERTGKAEPFSVYKRGENGRASGRALGSHPTREAAQAQIEAITINEARATRAADTLVPPPDVRAAAAAVIAAGTPLPERAQEIAGRLARGEVMDQETVRKLAAFHASAGGAAGAALFEAYGGAAGAAWVRSGGVKVAIKTADKTLTAGNAGSIGAGVTPGDTDETYEATRLGTAKYAMGDEVFVKSVFDAGMVSAVRLVRGSVLYTVKLASGGLAEVTAADISLAKAKAVKDEVGAIRACADEATRLLTACVDDGVYDRAAAAALHSALGAIETTGGQKAQIDRARTAIEQSAFSALRFTKSGETEGIQGVVAPSLSQAVTALRAACRTTAARKGIAHDIIGTLRLDKKQRRGVRFEAILAFRDKLPDEAARALWMVEAAYQTGKLNRIATQRFQNMTAYQAAMVIEQVVNAGCTTPDQAAAWLNDSNYGQPQKVRERDLSPAAEANLPPRPSPEAAVALARDWLDGQDAPSVGASGQAVRRGLFGVLGGKKSLSPEVFKAAIMPLRRGVKQIGQAIDPLQAQQAALDALDASARALTAGNGLVTAPGGRVDTVKAIKSLVDAAASVATKPADVRVDALGEAPEIVRAALQTDDPERLARIEEAFYDEGKTGQAWVDALAVACGV